MSPDRLRPQTLRGALVSLPNGGGRHRVIAFQYNPSSIRRSLEPQMVGGEENDRSRAVRYTSAPVQTIQLEIEFDATDALAEGDAVAESLGILPQLAALELLAYPNSSAVARREAKATEGVMEVAPLTAPQVLFIWGDQRVMPVRLTGFSIQEEGFDAQLHPIRAVVSISMRVLNDSDLDSKNHEYHLFQAYQKNLESEAQHSTQVRLGRLGIPASDL